MSRITNASFTPGTVISSTDVNAKFTDVATASASIDEDNVRNEGIDRINIDDTGMVKYWYTTTNAATSGTLYSEDELDAFAISHDGDMELDFGAAGITLADGEMLRLKYTLNVEKVLKTGSAVTQYDLFCAFPTWDITDNTLANYEALPDHLDLLPTIAAATNFPIEDAGGGTLNLTSGYTVWPLIGAADVPGYAIHRTALGNWSYLNDTGGNIIIYGIRLYGRGPFIMYWDAANSLKTFRATGVGDALDVTIERGQMFAQVLRNGDV